MTIPVRPYLAMNRGPEMELAENDRQIVIELIRKRLLYSSWIPTCWKINWYEHNFVAQEFADLAKVLAGIKGRFLMTISDTPEVREIFVRCIIEEVELNCSMSKREGADR